MTRQERVQLIRQYAAGGDEVLQALEGFPAGKLTARPFRGKWTAAEIVHHLADSEMTAAIRLRRLVAEDEAADPRLQPGGVRRTARLQRAGHRAGARGVPRRARDHRAGPRTDDRRRVGAPGVAHGGRPVRPRALARDLRGARPQPCGADCAAARRGESEGRREADVQVQAVTGGRNSAPAASAAGSRALAPAVTSACAPLGFNLESRATARAPRAAVTVAAAPRAGFRKEGGLPAGQRLGDPPADVVLGMGDLPRHPAVLEPHAQVRRALQMDHPHHGHVAAVEDDRNGHPCTRGAITLHSPHFRPCWRHRTPPFPAVALELAEPPAVT